MTKSTARLPTELLDIEQVCELLRHPKSWIYDTRLFNRPPGSLAVRVGRKLRWDPDDLATWWEAGCPETIGWTPNGR